MRSKSVVYAMAFIFICVCLLFTWSLAVLLVPIRGPFEGKAEFALRRLKRVDNHVGMPAGSEQWADEIVSSGADGLELLVQEVARGEGDLTRYQPSPVDMLGRFGEPGRLYLQGEFLRLRALCLLSPKECVKNQAAASFIMHALISQFADLTYIVEWAELVSLSSRQSNDPSSDPAARNGSHGMVARFAIDQIDKAIKEKWHGSSPPLVHCCMTDDDVLALEAWARLISASSGSRKYIRK